jgi:hypothetical protein
MLAKYFQLNFFQKVTKNHLVMLPPRTRQHVDFTSSQHFPDEATGVANNKRRKFGTFHDGGSESHIIEERGCKSDVFLSSVMTTAEEEVQPPPALCLFDILGIWRFQKAFRIEIIVWPRV